MSEEKKSGVPRWVWVVLVLAGVPAVLCTGIVVLGTAGAAAVAANPAVVTASGDKLLEDIHNKVATDAVAQYDIAKRQGDKMQTCVQAGFVAAAYLQAKDETNYTQWKATEKADCTAAGVPK